MIMVQGIDDRGLPSRVCTFCSRLRSFSERQCDAFTESFAIPDEIWSGENDHRQPVEGDGGLLFNWLDEPDGRETDEVLSPDDAAVPE